MPWKALGLEIHPAESESQAVEIFQTLVKSEQYAILYVEEFLLGPLQQEIGRIQNSSTLAISVIPGRGESQGLGLLAQQQTVTRATGIDFKKEVFT